MSITLNGTTGISSTGGIAAADLTGTLPALDGAALTALTSANLTGALPAISGAALTGIESGPTYATAVATTSGTAVDFTGIPAGVKEIKLFLTNVSLTSNEFLMVQMGTSSGFITTGYLGSSVRHTATASGEQHNTTGFLIADYMDASSPSGVMTFTRNSQSGHVWNQTNAFGGVYSTITGAGSLDTSTEVTQLRITAAAQSPTFRLGTANISWSF